MSGQDAGKITIELTEEEARGLIDPTISPTVTREMRLFIEDELAKRGSAKEGDVAWVKSGKMEHLAQYLRDGYGILQWFTMEGERGGLCGVVRYAEHISPIRTLKPTEFAVELSGEDVGNLKYVIEHIENPGTIYGHKGHQLKGCWHADGIKVLRRILAAHQELNSDE